MLQIGGSRATVTGGVTLLLLTVALLLLWIMLRQHRNLAASRTQLAAQNHRFDAALNNMRQGLVMFDAEARLVVCNDRYIEMYGLSPAGHKARRYSA